MWFLYITFGVGVVNCVLDYLVTANATYMFKKQYPGIKLVNGHWSVRALTIIKSSIIHFCPIVNIFFLVYYLFGSDDISRGVVEKTYEKYKEQTKHELIQQVQDGI